MKLYFTEADIQFARHAAAKIGRLKQNRFGIKSHINGLIGEHVFTRYLRSVFADHITVQNDRNYDLLLKDLRIEIKTKKINSGRHKINAVSAHRLQICDVYVFLLLKYANDNKSAGYVVFNGAVSRQKFIKYAQFKKSKRFDTFQIQKHYCHTLPAFLDLCYTTIDKTKTTIHCVNNISKEQLIEKLLISS